MKEQHKALAPLAIFYAASKKDEGLATEFAKHLQILPHHAIIAGWSMNKMTPAMQDWQGVEETLKQASHVLLLISPDFLASPSCQALIERAVTLSMREESIVVPVLLRPARWETTPLGRLQCVPTNKKYVTRWTDQDSAFVTIIEELEQTFDHPVPSALAPTSLSQSTRFPHTRELLNRDRLLKRVSTDWIMGVLQPSLHQADLITLDLLEQPYAVLSPWHKVMQETTRTVRPLIDTAILDVYQEAEGELLILGPPGAGKTTLLLTLTRELLKQAEKNALHPMPVFFHLSTWSSQHPSLTVWLIAELKEKYRVPLKIAQQWIETQQVIPLLDGLDEVKVSEISACITSINTYYQKDAALSLSTPLVVCSRSDAYLAQPERLWLRRAVMIQPLTEPQIASYLTSAGKRETIQALLMHNQALRTLTTYPLTLTILTLAYQETDAKKQNKADIPQEISPQSLFAMYIRTMLTRRNEVTDYTPSQIDAWLTWLAQQMRSHHQTPFYPGRIPPDWLPSGWPRSAYYSFIGLIGACCLGSTLGMAAAVIQGPVSGMLPGTIGALAGGIGFAVIARRIKPIEILRRSSVKNRILPLLFYSAVWIILLLLHTVQTDIFGLLATLMLACAIIPILIAELINDLPGAMLDPSVIVTPDESLQRSIQNGVRIGLLTATSLSLFIVASYLGGLLKGDILLGSLLGLLLGLLNGLAFGGLAALQISSIRWLLWRSQKIPKNYMQFLTFTTERLLLRKVGSGYMFVHPLLRDYFASPHTLQGFPETYKGSAPGRNRKDELIQEAQEDDHQR